MRFISTRGESPAVTASDAILQGLAPDGGLYVPESMPALRLEDFPAELSYAEIATRMLAPFFAEDPLAGDLPAICREAFDFPIPLHWHDESKAVLELIHGPTAAFKDFGARFLASSMQRISERKQTSLTILVATSGDTGGAVAAAFHGKHNIAVKVLYPLGRVSKRQEKQLTCWGDNVSAYSVLGAFDDCQKMVKDAFMDAELREQHHLTSANSINLGRLLPQSVYYLYAALQYQRTTGKRPVIVIPSGNVGNSVGAYIAKAMGAPIERIVLAVNANKTIPDFLESGSYEARESIATLANAMDVGDPSNMERLRFMFPDIESMRANIAAFSVSDEQIREEISLVWHRSEYAVCPHTASGEFVRNHFVDVVGAHSIVVATAHPAKFETIVEPVIDQEIPIPENLAMLLDRKGSAVTINPTDKNWLNK